MPRLLRNVLAIVGGIVAGAVVNGALITLSASLIPAPPGVDVTNTESLAKGMHLFEPRHFAMPFLAHALGTFFGGLAAYLMASSHKPRIAYVIGVVFLCGGVAASFMIPAPGWFMALDLALAYLPMAWLAIRAGSRMQSNPSAQQSWRKA